MTSPPKGLIDQNLIADADLCVKCGLCLEHCPTYLQTRNEADSPRGRIALVQGLGSGLITTTEATEAHLDGCLSCRRCEVVCPARVPYARILDGGRAHLTVQRPERARLTRLLELVLLPRAMRSFLRVLLNVYRWSGLQFLVRRTGLLGTCRIGRLASLIPAHGENTARVLKQVRHRRRLEIAAPEAPELALFEGCVTQIVEAQVLKDARYLLQAAGYRLREVPGQGCCGALHQHGGMPEKAAQLARINSLAFAGVSGIASCTTGCAATLTDYADLDGERGAVLASKVKDIASWLLPRSHQLRFRPMALRVALHVPCSARNVLRSDGELRLLLAQIPELEVMDLDPAHTCCGAAGSHFISHPQAADQLLAPKLAAVRAMAPDLILSANVGCSMHLAGGLARSRQPVPPVLHPVQLLVAALA